MAEGGGLLNRYTVKSCIGGSNPPLSAKSRNPNHVAQHRAALSSPEFIMRRMIASRRSLCLARLAATEPTKHVPHWLTKFLTSGHKVPLIAVSLAVVVLLAFGVFKLSQFRSR